MKKIVFIVIAVFVCISLALVVYSCASYDSSNKPVGGRYNARTMKGLIKPPQNIPCHLRVMIDIADKKAKKKMMPGRLLAWSSKAAISSGLLELYVEEAAAAKLDPRLIKMLRIIVSYTVPSRFAIDINAWGYTKFRITANELLALQGTLPLKQVSSFSPQELVVLQYARALSRTPIVLTQGVLDGMRRYYSARDILLIASLTAKVNYWARLIEALRIKPAGYTKDPLLRLGKYRSYAAPPSAPKK